VKLVALNAVTKALNAEKVRYLMAGGVAVSAHGYIRITTETELVAAIDTGQRHLAFRALASIGYCPTEPVDSDTFPRPEQRQGLRQETGMQVLDFQSDTFTSTPVGLLVQPPFDFPHEYHQAMRSEILPGVEVRFLSVSALIRLKRITDSHKDRDDIQHLQWLQDDYSQIDENDEDFRWSMTTFEGVRKMQLIQAKKLSVRQRLKGLDDLMEVTERLQSVPRHSRPKTDGEILKMDKPSMSNA